jgi:hypothetical protein
MSRSVLISVFCRQEIYNKERIQGSCTVERVGTDSMIVFTMIILTIQFNSLFIYILTQQASYKTGTHSLMELSPS